MRLSKRLSLISDMVSPGSRVCDVGTDHGYLPAFLYNSGRCESVCATDIKQKPLDNARKNLANSGAEGVELYLCDGLQKITRDMADTVIIAGIGGEVISGIIDRAEFLRDDTVTLILQPTTSADILRIYLANHGFIVVCERAVKDSGKLYSVMKCHYCGIEYPIDNLRKVIGIITPDYPDGMEYIKKQYKIIKKRSDEIRNTGKETSLYKSDLSVLAKIEKLIILEDNNGI